MPIFWRCQGDSEHERHLLICQTPITVCSTKKGVNFWVFTESTFLADGWTFRSQWQHCRSNGSRYLSKRMQRQKSYTLAMEKNPKSIYKALMCVKAGVNNRKTLLGTRSNYFTRHVSFQDECSVTITEEVFVCTVQDSKWDSSYTAFNFKVVICTRLLVRKKDGSVRWCIDYRQVDQKTVKDSYPFPNIEHCLSTLSGSIYFTH